MALPIEIESKIALIPDVMNIIKWPFVILKKTSASSSILILTKEPKPDSDGCPTKKVGGNIPVALKIWCKPRPGRKAQDEEESLEYEKKVYFDYIRNIVAKNPNAPFLHYLGDDNNCSTVQTLADYIGATDKGSLTTLCLACYMMDELVMYADRIDVLTKPINYNGKKLYREYFKKFPVSGVKFLKKFNEIINWKIGAILMPSVNYKPFSDIMGTDIQVSSFRQIVQGLYQINQVELVHNDLHSHNIMIEEKTNKVMIYDWDRAYSPGLGNNKYLNNDPCKEMCSYSQCNIFMGGRPIDLVKILCYTVYDKPNFNQLLEEGLKIQNIVIAGKQRFATIRQGIQNTGGKRCMYTDDVNKCSSLYKVNNSPVLEEAINHLGSWPVIYARAFPGKNTVKINPVYRPKARSYLQIVRATGIALAIASTAVFAAYIKERFGFGKFGMVAISPPSRKHRHDEYDEEIRARKMYKEGEKIEKQSVFKLDDRMVEEIKKLTRFPINAKMQTEMSRLEKIPEHALTWDDYVRLEDLAEYVQYGPPVPVEKPVLISASSVKAIPFGEILEKNEAMKIYKSQ